MTLYNVHIYREMRLRFDNLEADRPEAAAEKAREMHFDDADDYSDCEGESLAALVDVQGDEEYEHSCLIDFEPGRLLKVAPKLRAALASLLDAIGRLPLTVRDEPFDDACRRAEAALAESGTLVGLTVPMSRFTPHPSDTPPSDRKGS